MKTLPDIQKEQDAVLEKGFWEHRIPKNTKQMSDLKTYLHSRDKAIVDGVREAVLELVQTHTEHRGDCCDTGEDMEWSCRSECIEMDVARLESFFTELNK